MNIIIPIWQWIMENRFEIERVAKFIWHYHIPNVTVIQYPPAVKFFIN